MNPFRHTSAAVVSCVRQPVRRPNRTAGGYRLVCRGLLAAVLVCGFFQVCPATAAAKARARTPADDRTDKPASSAPIEQFEIAFAQAASAIAPSVVSITSTRTVTRSGSGGSPFGDMFGGRMPDFFETPQQPREYKSRGLGSGVIVDGQGHILTNNHVVEDADELRVHLADGRSVEATVVGTDPKSDLAVIAIDTDDITPADLASDQELRVGRWVLAVGSPFGLEQTVTAGIISASGRVGIGIADYEDLIQTDAAINRGNSGGPLINLEGEVVGINTAIISPTGGNQGIGFAIPIGMARKVMDSLIERGEVVRGWLGVWIQSLTPDLAATFEYERDYGALVGDVIADGPAADAGLRSGDIIMEIDGEKIDDASVLRNQVAATDPGTTVAVTVWRDGRRRTLDVTLERLPDDTGGLAKDRAGDAELEGLGVRFADLTDDLRSRLELGEDVRGVVVAAIARMGPAAEAGLRVGDVITHVQGEAVRDTRALRAALREADLAEGARLRVRRGDGSRFVLLKNGGE